LEIPVAIVVKPNVVTTILNALLKRRACDSIQITGTTRDTIKDEFHIGEYASFRFIDTAGIRETKRHVKASESKH
jgi:tRNA modification GTPase